MTAKNYSRLAAMIFAIAAVLQLARYKRLAGHRRHDIFNPIVGKLDCLRCCRCARLARFDASRA